jgi:cytochrome c oxidase subunit 1
MTLVGVSYVLVGVSMDGKSVYGKKMAKSLFLLYPITVPPTFLYHLMADPSIPAYIKSIGTALSLLVGLPTIVHMFIIMGMMESKVRSAGHSGIFGWIKHLPWKNPAFSCMITGMISMGFGGILAYVLLQEHASALLHGTFAVPAYLHPMAAGGATLIYMGAAYYMVAGITKRQLWGLSIARIQPFISTIGLFIFGIAGSIGGYAGIPRRLADTSLGGNAPSGWDLPLNISLGIGGILSAIGGIFFVLVLVMTALAGKKTSTVREAIDKGLMTPYLPEIEEVKSTPTSLIPGTIFTILAVVLTMIAYYLITQWPIQF